MLVELFWYVPADFTDTQRKALRSFARVDDAHWRLAAHKIRIDHHIHVGSFCDEELIDPSAAATCELIGALCAEQGEQLSRECAERLYGGLISDTVNFTIGSVSERTLRVAAYLFSFGVDAVKLNMQQFGTNLRDFRYESHLRASMQMRGSLAWVIASRRDFESYGLQFSEAKEKVFVMAGIRESPTISAAGDTAVPAASRIWMRARWRR